MRRWTGSLGGLGANVHRKRFQRKRAGQRIWEVWSGPPSSTQLSSNQCMYMSKFPPLDKEPSKN